jgi:phosphoglycerate dehydrogenase-like enzyme
VGAVAEGAEDDGDGDVEGDVEGEVEGEVEGDVVEADVDGVGAVPVTAGRSDDAWSAAPEQAPMSATTSRAATGTAVTGTVVTAVAVRGPRRGERMDQSLPSAAARPGREQGARRAYGEPMSPAAERDLPVVVTLPETDLLQRLDPPAGVELRLWDCEAPPPDAGAISVVVAPYLGHASLEVLAQVPHLRLVQTLSAGYEHVLPHLPDGVALVNAVGVHDASTAELAVGLTLAALRGLPGFVLAQSREQWRPQRSRSLADRRVLVVGYGGVGRAVAARLRPFEVSLTAVASRARPAGPDGQPVLGVDELPALLGDHDVVVLTVPLSDSTRGMVDAAFLAAMPDGALLVNVARGGVVVTDALLAELTAGRLVAALDVTDPEPLPAGHPLWSAPGVLVSPHVGGATTAMRPRALALLTEQLERLATGRPLLGVVVESPWAGPGARAR